MLRAVATDGHRLARVEMPLPDGADGMPGVIVPRKTVGELRKLLEETDGRVEVALSDAKIRFAFGEVVLTSKLIDGTFPDYRARHPDRQRQGHGGAEARVRRGRRPRLHHLHARSRAP